MNIERALVRLGRLASEFRLEADHAQNRSHVQAARECRLRAQTIEQAIAIIEESDEAVA